MQAHLKTRATDVKATVCTYVTDSSKHNTMVMLELYGATEAMRAIWANIVKHRPKQTGYDSSVITEVVVGESKLKVIPTDRYQTLMIDGHLFIAHAGLSVKDRQYIVEGDDKTPSPWFFQLLQRQVPDVPILQEWTTALWVLGIQHKLVKACDVYGGGGRMFWRINKSASWRGGPDKTWAHCVKEVVTA